MAKSRSNPEAFKFYGYFQRSSKMVRWIERNQILIFWRGRLFRLSESEGYSVVSDSLRPRGLHSPWNSPGQNTGVGSLSLLQGIFSYFYFALFLCSNNNVTFILLKLYLRI